MTAPWALHHKWWKKWLPWYLYQKRDLKRAQLIHCTSDFEIEWNKSIGLGKDFLAPLGTFLPEDGLEVQKFRSSGVLEFRDSVVRSDGCEGLNAETQRRRAVEKVEEWLEGVDEVTFVAALEKLVAEKKAAGEYLFEQEEDPSKAITAAKAFFKGYSRRLVELSDGRYVYFVPDSRAKLRNADNSLSWAEYAFHAVSSGGHKIPGKSYNYRKYNEYKVVNTDLIEGTLKSERCVPVLKSKSTQDAVKFFGAAHLGGLFDVVVRLDECGNANANMTEVTFEASTKRGQKKLPQLVSLAEAVRTVVSHQTATGTYPPNKSIIANTSDSRKGEWAECLNVGIGECLNKDGQFHSTTTTTNYNSTPKTLLYVGRIYPVKALDRLIEAFALAAKQKVGGESRWTKDGSGFDWVLRLVGPDQAGHMAELMALCDRHKLPYATPEQSNNQTIKQSNNFLVEFVGPKFGPDLDAEYANCTALALVSHTENFGATVVDALAHGKPVITSTHTPWSIVQGKSSNQTIQQSNNSSRCGWWVDNDVESLSRTLSELLNLSTSELLLMGRNGRALVEREYTWSAVAEKLVKQYALIFHGDCL